jgi:hypothetical protein
MTLLNLKELKRLNARGDDHTYELILSFKDDTTKTVTLSKCNVFFNK